MSNHQTQLYPTNSWPQLDRLQRPGSSWTDLSEIVGCYGCCYRLVTKWRTTANATQMVLLKQYSLKLKLKNKSTSLHKTKHCQAGRWMRVFEISDQCCRRVLPLLRYIFSCVFLAFFHVQKGSFVCPWTCITVVQRCFRRNTKMLHGMRVCLHSSKCQLVLETVHKIIYSYRSNNLYQRYKLFFEKVLFLSTKAQLNKKYLCQKRISKNCLPSPITCAFVFSFVFVIQCNFQQF